MNERSCFSIKLHRLLSFFKVVFGLFYDFFAIEAVFMPCISSVQSPFCAEDICFLFDRAVQFLIDHSTVSRRFLLTRKLARLLLFSGNASRATEVRRSKSTTTTGKGLTMAKVYCKYCGNAFSSVQSLTSTTCPRHPDGVGKGRHALYEGDEAPEYTCKYCGKRASTIASLTSQTCPRHPDGNGKGRHSPAL